MLKKDKASLVKKGEALNLETLNLFLKNNGLETVHAIKQFSGGYSNLTYLLEAKRISYVLRKPPKGAKDIKGGHNMSREYAVLKALLKAGFIQIPKPLLLCKEDDILGSEFYIMEKVSGSILRASDAKTFLKEDNKSLFRNISRSICETQTKLHAIDIYQTSLIDIGKPEQYVQRQVSGWYKRYLASQTNDLPAMNKVNQWLEKSIPDSTNPTLIHNDYKYDNLLLNPQKPDEILAILDWEMCTVGDPLMDLGTTLAYWVEAQEEEFGKAFNLSWLPGNLKREEYANLYHERTGTNISNILFYYVFGLFKNAVIIQQIYARYKKGLSQDPRFANLLQGVQLLASKATNSIDKDRML